MNIKHSPQLSQKFKTNEEDTLQVNNFLVPVFGPSVARRLKEFKCCFDVQYPMVTMPLRKTHTNWNIDIFLKHFLEVSRSARLLTLLITIDDQVADFKGSHQYKIRIKYKAEGDRSQMDAIYDFGFTYAFYLSNHPQPKNI